jgi:hypothetical protein
MKNWLKKFTQLLIAAKQEGKFLFIVRWFFTILFQLPAFAWHELFHILTILQFGTTWKIRIFYILRFHKKKANSIKGFCWSIRTECFTHLECLFIALAPLVGIAACFFIIFLLRNVYPISGIMFLYFCLAVENFWPSDVDLNTAQSSMAAMSKKNVNKKKLPFLRAFFIFGLTKIS